ncbi:hypothetical protein CsSME_00010464 [Camellia sinensis var. sinensis]
MARVLLRLGVASNEWVLFRCVAGDGFGLRLYKELMCHPQGKHCPFQKTDAEDRLLRVLKTNCP